MTQRTTRTPVQRTRDVTRERLLAVAEDVFLSRGFLATSVEAVAAEAGYTTGAIYSNFGGKADLFLAVLERATSADLAAVRAALDAADSDEQRLAVFSSSVTSDRARWHDRLAATMEFLSFVRHRPELHDRVRAAQDL